MCARCVDLLSRSILQGQREEWESNLHIPEEPLPVGQEGVPSPVQVVLRSLSSGWHQASYQMTLLHFYLNLLNLDGILKSSFWTTMVSQWGDMTSPWIPQRLSRTLTLWWTTSPRRMTMRMVPMMRSPPWGPHSNKRRNIQYKTINYVTHFICLFQKSLWLLYLSGPWSDWEKVWFSVCDDGSSLTEVVHYSCEPLVSSDNCDFSSDFNIDKCKLAIKWKYFLKSSFNISGFVLWSRRWKICSRLCYVLYETI